MTNPAVYIVFGVVAAVAALVGIFAATSSGPQAHSYGKQRSSSGPRYRSPSPPPTPPPSSVRKREKRRKSPERRSNSSTEEQQPERNQRSPERLSDTPAHVSTPATTARTTCRNCGELLHIKINPCNHASLCKGCFMTYLEENNTCPDCEGRIDSCSPPIPPLGKCRRCKKFTKLFKFLPCNHSLSLCIGCFEEEDKSYKVCPECEQRIKGSEPMYTSSGICGVCSEFTRFALFQPCGHGNFCRRHASQYLENSNQECSECCGKVTEFI